MCGRFSLLQTPEEVEAFFALEGLEAFPPRYNIAPTQPILVISAAPPREPGSNRPDREAHLVRWGLLPSWVKDPKEFPLLINARAETIADKPAFRAACRARRCLIPVTGFYEWTKDGDGNRLPWYIRRADGDTLAFAGIWQDWARDGEALRTCAIVTTAANTKMQAIHHRMPVVLEPADWPLWLGEAGKGAAPLMQPADDAVLEFYRVDPKVNSNRASGPELIEPFDD